MPAPTMITSIVKKRPLATLIFCSVLAHIAVLSFMGGTGIFDLSAPVAVGRYLQVDLQEQDGTFSEVKRKVIGHEPAGATTASSSEMKRNGDYDESEKLAAQSVTNIDRESKPTAEDDSKLQAATAEETGKSAIDIAPAPEQSAAVSSGAPARHEKPKLEPPLRKGNEFVTASNEKLTYVISLHGIPVGKAVLAAKNLKGEVSINVKVNSSPLISGFYPVDDEIQTEIICGNYIITKIRQHEGTYTRNAGFTLMLREKKAFSTDRLRDRFVSDPLPREDVTDILTGFYFLRNQPIEVGNSLLLYLYDSGEYSPTTVEVLRKEQIYISGLGKVDTLVIQPHLKTAGIFRRTGDILVWLTADSFKVPVRMQTSVPLGDVTAELVSSEVER